MRKSLSEIKQWIEKKWIKFLLQKTIEYFKGFSELCCKNIETDSRLYMPITVRKIGILKQKDIALLVTDIVMPKIDGMVLLSYTNNKHPHIPCIVMTSHPTTILDDTVSKDNLIRFFQKPFELGELTETILQALNHDVPNGTLRGISVASFLQMIEMEEKTCLLEVQSFGREKGIFYLEEGAPYDAVCGNLNGEEAAYKLIGMEEAEISFKTLPMKKVNRRIDTELTSLIMEAFRRKDEELVL